MKKLDSAKKIEFLRKATLIEVIACGIGCVYSVFIVEQSDMLIAIIAVFLGILGILQSLYMGILQIDEQEREKRKKTNLAIIKEVDMNRDDDTNKNFDGLLKLKLYELENQNYTIKNINLICVNNKKEVYIEYK